MKTAEEMSKQMIRDGVEFILAQFVDIQTMEHLWSPPCTAPQFTQGSPRTCNRPLRNRASARLFCN